MKPAIIIIDMENDFFRENPILRKKRSVLIKNINNLISYARKRRSPIIWIRQEFKPDLSDAYLFMKKTRRKITIKGTVGAEILDELKKAAKDVIIVKNRYSAFFKTRLERLLNDIKADTLILAGINTHACVRMTAIDAYQRDFKIILAKDCIASWDKKHHDITIRYLNKSMGIEILSNEQLKNKL